MKTFYKNILFLAVAAIVLANCPTPCGAAEEDDSFWQDEPSRRHRRPELTEEKIELMMDRMAEKNPQRAKELAELRDKDPKEFKRAIHKEFAKWHRMQRSQGREEFKGYGREPRGPGREHGRRGERGFDDDRGDRGERGRRGKRGDRRRGPERQERIRRKSDELLEWLEQNYPEKGKELAQLREKDPELFRERMKVSLKKYSRIMEKSKKNPQLAEIFKKQMELKGQRNELRKKIQAATDEQEKRELTGQLEQVLGKRFDLLVKKKQIEYEQLLKKLEAMKQKVEKSKTKVETWNKPEFKTARIKEQLEKLISGKEDFKWE